MFILQSTISYDVTKRHKFFYHFNPEVVGANPTFGMSVLFCVLKEALLGTDLPSRVTTQVYTNDMETQEQWELLQ